MTDLLNWQLIGDREPWRDDVDTQQPGPGERKVDPSDSPESRSIWSEQVFAQADSAEMVEDIPRGLVDGYAFRACQHAVAREVDPGVWIASVVGLDGAYGEGDSGASATEDLLQAIVGWVAVKRRLGQRIPEIDGLDLNLVQRSVA